MPAQVETFKEPRFHLGPQTFPFLHRTRPDQAFFSELLSFRAEEGEQLGESGGGESTVCCAVLRWDLDERLAGVGADDGVIIQAGEGVERWGGDDL